MARNKRKRGHRTSQGYWQSYSDMMAALLLMFSAGCEMQLPNPIVGTYVKFPHNSDHDFIAAIAFRNDGSFSYYQSSADGRDYEIYEGKYSIVLRSFNFLEADGNLVFTYWTGTVAKSDPMLFKWKCDKDRGPKSINLVRNPDDQMQNLEFGTYYGNEHALDDFFADMKAKLEEAGV